MPDKQCGPLLCNRCVESAINLAVQHLPHGNEGWLGNLVKLFADGDLVCVWAIGFFTVGDHVGEALGDLVCGEQGSRASIL